MSVDPRMFRVPRRTFPGFRPAAADLLLAVPGASEWVRDLHMRCTRRWNLATFRSESNAGSTFR